MSYLAALVPVLAQTEQRLGDSLDMSVKLVIAVATLLGSIGLGLWLGKTLRMPNHGWRFAVLLFSAFAGIVIVALGWPPKLGVDLSGGVILVYEVDPGKKVTGQTIDMGELVSSIGRRINPGGQKEVVVRPFGVEQVEIIIPNVDSQTLDEIKHTISTSGLLEFRILANHTDHDRIIKRALANPQLREVVEGTGEDAKVVARWVKADKEKFASERRDVTMRAIDEKGEEREVLVAVDPFNVTGDYLSITRQEFDENGRPCVSFNLNSDGARRFAQLTTKYAPDPQTGFERILGIVLDDVLRDAPNLHEPITGGTGRISGGAFTEREVVALVGILNAGKLPAALRKEPISEQLIGPQLGADTIRSASYAMILSAILVPLFMIVYYRFSGIVATFAMLLNVLLVVAFMIAIKAPFTLSGLAGLCLTLGMAVDANVLIYERMREEKARGAALRMVVRNGFDRAFATIVDAHLTTLIAATVLYWIGTDQVKGFAITLWLGVLLNIFTATFCTRIVFDVAEKFRWLTQLKMMKLFDVPNYDFLGKRHLWISISLVQIAIGLVAVYFRVHQGNLLDIDFAGGTEVEVLFQQPEPDVNVVRKAAAAVLPDVGVSPVNVTGEAAGSRYRVDTSEQQLSKVKEKLKEAFPGKLAALKLAYEDLHVIPKGGAAAPDAKQGTGVPLPANNVLAMAATEPWLLAQATEASPSDSQPADSQPTDSRPAATPGAKPADQPFPAPGGGQTPPPGGQTAPTAPVAPAPDPYAGGTQTRLSVDAHPVPLSVLRSQIDAAFDALKDQGIPKVSFDLKSLEPESPAESKTWQLKMALDAAQTEKVLKTVQAALLNSPAFPSSNNFGPQVAGKTTQNAIYALVLSWALMILYIWFRFQRVAYGLAAVLSLVHDVLVALGAVALSWYVADYLGFLLVQPFKINLGSIAAFLTIIGYSVNDTIVTFDRVREVKGKSPEVTEHMLNLSVNQTLSRTLLTTFTVFLVVFILYVAGGQELHGFAFTLLVGIVCGAYSTIYVAAPLLLWVGRGRARARRVQFASAPPRRRALRNGNDSWAIRLARRQWVSLLLEGGWGRTK